MSQVTFTSLPDHARLWIFPADRRMSAEERERLSQAVERGLIEWNAHGSPVRWGYDLAEEQFLWLGVDESQTELSGCSIDSCIQQIRELEQDLDISLLDNSRVFYDPGSGASWAGRPDFREMATRGDVTRDTLVYNTVLQTVGELRNGGWKVPARDSWHGNAFPFAS